MLEAIIKNKLIVVDPGHGGRDPGAMAGQIKEKEIVLPYAHGLAAALRALGYRVELTRLCDVDMVPDEKNWRVGKGMDLRKRSEFANSILANLFVSIHANWSQNNKANGAWVLYSKGSKKGLQCATLIFKELAKVAGIPDFDPEPEVYSDATGWVGGRTLSVLQRTSMPAVLIELGFMSSPDDLKQLLQTETVVQCSNAIAKGIDLWFDAQG